MRMTLNLFATIMMDNYVNLWIIKRVNLMLGRSDLDADQLMI